MQRSLEQIIAAYRKDSPLERASTIPAAWYTDARVSELERLTVFKRSWQVAGRRDAVRAAVAPLAELDVDYEAHGSQVVAPFTH